MYTIEDLKKKFPKLIVKITSENIHTLSKEPELEFILKILLEGSIKKELTSRNFYSDIPYYVHIKDHRYVQVNFNIDLLYYESHKEYGDRCRWLMLGKARTVEKGGEKTAIYNNYNYIVLRSNGIEVKSSQCPHGRQRLVKTKECPDKYFGDKAKSTEIHFTPQAKVFWSTEKRDYLEAMTKAQEQKNYLGMVQRNLGDMSLFRALNAALPSKPLSPLMRLSIALSLAEAIKRDCFDKNILHCDIKPDNIILELTAGLARLCDWGLGRNKESRKTTRGTLTYIAPEAIPEKYHNSLNKEKFDISSVEEDKQGNSISSELFSLGMVLADIFQLTPLDFLKLLKGITYGIYPQKETSNHHEFFKDNHEELWVIIAPFLRLHPDAREKNIDKLINPVRTVAIKAVLESYACRKDEVPLNLKAETVRYFYEKLLNEHNLTSKDEIPDWICYRAYEAYDAVVKAKDDFNKSGKDEKEEYKNSIFNAYNSVLQRPVTEAEKVSFDIPILREFPFEDLDHAQIVDISLNVFTGFFVDYDKLDSFKEKRVLHFRDPLSLISRVTNFLKTISKGDNLSDGEIKEVLNRVNKLIPLATLEAYQQQLKLIGVKLASPLDPLGGSEGAYTNHIVFQEKITVERLQKIINFYCNDQVKCNKESLAQLIQELTSKINKGMDEIKREEELLPFPKPACWEKRFHNVESFTNEEEKVKYHNLKEACAYKVLMDDVEFSHRILKLELLNIGNDKAMTLEQKKERAKKAIESCENKEAVKCVYKELEAMKGEEGFHPLGYLRQLRKNSLVRVISKENFGNTESWDLLMNSGEKKSLLPKVLRSSSS